MKRFVLCVMMLPLLGTTCPVPSIGVPCANDLNAAEFGFTLSAPADFECITVQPNAALLVSVRYRQGSSGPILSVVLAPSGEVSTECDDATTCTDLADFTNSAGVTFTRTKIDAPVLSVFSIIGLVTLPNGNVLGITIAGFTDDPALGTILETVLESVRLT